jgi:DNA helicase-2/ATP-dependent DNA helicase PcrA
LLRLLCQKHRNLCCVGDDDQSIYSWRGAEIENILRFEKDFTDARVIRLERNYRSTKTILSAASSLIAHNEGRLGKTLKVAENSPAQACADEKIRVISTYNGEEEAAFVAAEIENLHRAGESYADMAVLVRTAFQTREFEEKFIAEAIPYQVVGGPKFYERQEIRDILAYFRVILQPHDDLAFERIINKPARGIGAKSVEKFQNYARENGISLFMAVQRMLGENLISGKAKNALSELIDLFGKWRQAEQAVSPDELAMQVLEDSGYWEMLKNDQSVEAPGRIDNLKELVGVMSDDKTYPTLNEFLEHVSLVMDNDQPDDRNKVMLMTLHSAKGLEFDTVFLPGWEDGLFPHQRSLDEGGSEALEEERRLAYVALTRAKQKLYILMAFSRRVYGQWQNNIPSRFLNEIPPYCLEICNYANKAYGGGYQNYSSQRLGTDRRRFDKQTQSRYSYEPDDTYAAPKSVKGTRVMHETFGYGTLISLENSTADVMFDRCGRKKIRVDFLRKA